jgi:LacI family transcriptional regulator
MSPAKPKKVSIYTLSEELDLSPATVSRALRNHQAVSAKVRARVQQVAQEKNYKPRFVSRKVTNLCVLVQQYDGHPLDFTPFIAMVMEGVAEYCRHEELEMSLYSEHVHELNNSDIVRQLRRRNADGVIVLRANDQATYFSQMDAQNFPYYCAINKDGAMIDRLLDIDDESLAAQAGEHLVKLGHRRIGVLINAPYMEFAQHRLAGYRKACRAAGFDLDESRIRTADIKRHRGDFAFGKSATQELLADHPDTTALLVTSEQAAVGALSWLYENNIKVPEEVSVVGFDNFSGTAYTCPPLTTINVPYKHIGYECARQVHRMIRDLEPLITEESQQRITGQLIVRNSTAPLREAIDA